VTKRDPVLEKLRAICLALPDTKQTITWGKPHFRVGEKIFAGYGAEDGKASMGFKLEPLHAKRIVQDPRFRPAPYVGHKGWVSMDAGKVSDWEEVRALVLESYRLIAPKRSQSKLLPEGDATVKAKAKPKAKAKAKAKARVSRRKSGA
jgi:predicted DNA-binding protein (MmcQ/YjbR family)